MNILVALFIIILVVLADYFWFDADQKRWGWMKKWPKLNKGLFFSGFIVISILIYLGLSIKYFN